MHTPLAAVYLELGLPEPGEVWARETLRLWRKVAALERGRLPREAWEYAREQGKRNSFVARAEAAHALLMGGPLPAATPVPGARACGEAKVAVAAALKRRAAEKWKAHVEMRADTGMAFYDGAPAPGAAGGFRARVPPAGCSHTGRRMLVAHRLHGHYLQSCAGGLRGVARPVAERVCPRCQDGWCGMGSAPVEDEAHFWAECPALRPARQRMLEELDCVYPGFERRFAALPRLEKGRALAFGVPDGTWLPGASRVTWARGVRAVVRFGMETAVLCPVLGQAMWRMER